MRTRRVALWLMLSVLTGSAYATLHVDDNAPGDPLPFDRQVSDPAEDGSAEHPFDSIQEAIDAAGEGDTIVVAPGHYLSPDTWLYDQISFQGKNIRLVSSAPTDFRVAEETVLCGVVVFQGTEDPNCLLQGFKIENRGHGGILGNNTQATISHCILRGNGPCGSTVVKDVQGHIRNCLIVDNKSFHACGILPVMSGCIRLTNCTIANNPAGISILDEGVVSGSFTIIRTIITNCILYGNQGPSVIYVNRRGSGISMIPTTLISYCLIEDWTTLGPTMKLGSGSVPILDADPHFVRMGYWQGQTLIEGDYHLMSEGWRWSDQEVHGSHWYFDLATSPAIDAGHPLDSLGEEPERTPDDPEGRWGVNRAINLGAYGGTAQASLAPTQGRPPGIGAVDLQDYLSLTVGYSWTARISAADSRTRTLRVEFREGINDHEVYFLSDSSSLWWRDIACVYIADTLYKAGNIDAVYLLPQVSPSLQPQYPRYLTIGSTVAMPEGPLGIGTAPGRTAVVVRGSLAEVIAGTDLNASQFISSSHGWSDVIALREQCPDGTPGSPLAIFARGFGPLMLDGRPVTRAQLGNTTFLVTRTAEDFPSAGPHD